MRGATRLLGGALLIAAALVVTGCGGGPAAPSPAPADDAPVQPMQDGPPLMLGVKPVEPVHGAVLVAWGGHDAEPNWQRLFSGTSGSTPPASPEPPPEPPPVVVDPPVVDPPFPPPVVHDGTYLPAPAGCCGCAGGDDGWGWNFRVDGACGFSGTIVPGLCGCELYRDTTDPNRPSRLAWVRMLTWA